MPENDSITCPACLVGRLHPQLVTYSAVYNRTLVSVPNMPAWKCDFCHAIDYDEVLITRVEALIGQSGPPPNRHRPKVQPPVMPKPGVFSADS